jgi:hypothetical protein
MVSKGTGHGMYLHGSVQVDQECTLLFHSFRQVANIFFREVFKRHGLPRYIVSDRDNKFINAFWHELFRLSRIDLIPSTIYHPHRWEDRDSKQVD